MGIEEMHRHVCIVLSKEEKEDIPKVLLVHTANMHARHLLFCTIRLSVHLLQIKTL